MSRWWRLRSRRAPVAQFAVVTSVVLGAGFFRGLIRLLGATGLEPVRGGQTFPSSDPAAPWTGSPTLRAWRRAVRTW